MHVIRYLKVFDRCANITRVVALLDRAVQLLVLEKIMQITWGLTLIELEVAGKPERR